MIEGPSPDDDEDGHDEDGTVAPAGASTQRLDKWLWCARLAKTRTQAAALITGGKIRVNRTKTDKPALAVRPGDVVTASVGPHVRVLKITRLAIRRGPAPEARLLFEDLSAPRVGAATGDEGSAPRRTPSSFQGPVERRDQGSGRPTKRDRRAIDRLKNARDPD